MKALISAVIGATATAMVAYLSRNHRLPRVGHALARAMRWTGKWAWGNTNFVLYLTIVAIIVLDSYQYHQVHRLAVLNHVALCSYRSELADKLRVNEERLKHPFDLPEPLLQQLKLKVQDQRLAVLSLGDLQC